MNQYLSLVSPESLKLTLDQLDFVINDIETKGKAKEEAYGEKGRLLKRKTQLDTDIKLVEAEAIMNIQGEGRNQFVIIDDHQVALTNDTTRDAYRRKSSKTERLELANVESELAQLDAEIAQKNDAWYTAKETSENVRAKSNLQASLLNFLAANNASGQS